MIQALAGGMFDEITYFYIDEETKHGFMIDPGAAADTICHYVEENGWVIEKILLTHGHIDHICSADAVRKRLGCSVVIHEEGKRYLQDTAWNLSANFATPLSFEADEYVSHGSYITLQAAPQFGVRVIYAPGHTLDGCAYYAEQAGVAFVGDIIFQRGVGRSDLPGGDALRLIEAIKTQIFTLPEETILYPGHGNWTTVKEEKETNPVFNF